MEPTLAKNGIVIVDTTHNRLDRFHDLGIYGYQNLSDLECEVTRLSLSRKADMVLSNPTTFL